MVTNDDGYDARGIRELVAGLSRKGKVYVFAPAEQQSACGHGITFRRPIMIKEIDFPGAEKAWSVDGTPADCVKLGLRMLKQHKVWVDFIFSGINHGSNLGTDTLYSGTVSGAIEGVINGIPSVAVSICAHEPEHFETASQMIGPLFDMVCQKLDGRTVLNINLPNLPADQINGVRITKLGAREYDEEFKLTVGDDGELSYNYSGRPVYYTGLAGDIDVIALQDNCVSITPLHYDLTNYQRVNDVRGWGIPESFSKLVAWQELDSGAENQNPGEEEKG
jgi:5'-nucleotidase